MNSLHPGLFTLFVLAVCLLLSFVLRRLIQEIQLLREDLSQELCNFTLALVEQNPTLENYHRLGLLFFRQADYQRAYECFSRLSQEKLFSRQADFYRILCLIRLGDYQKAKRMMSFMDLSLFSQTEMNLIHLDFRKSFFLWRMLENAFRLMVTQVALPVPAYKDHGHDPLEIQKAKVRSSLPTRYKKLKFVIHNEIFMKFQGTDTHLQREVELYVLHPESETLQEDFLIWPRILASVQLSGLPQVFDLQTSDPVHFSLEILDAKNLEKILENSAKIADYEGFIRILLSLVLKLLAMESFGVRPMYLVLADLGYDVQKESVCFPEPLCYFDRNNDFASTEDVILPPKKQGLLSVFKKDLYFCFKKAIGFFSLNMQEVKEPDLFFELLTYLVENPEIFQKPESLVFRLERTLESLVLSRKGEVRIYLLHLGILEKLHRACVHGLKGRFSIVKRYGQDKQMLYKMFMRPQNLQDTVEKLDFYLEIVQELQKSVLDPGMLIYREVLSVDCLKIRQVFCEWLESAKDGQPSHEEVFIFLQSLYTQFFDLSASLSRFIDTHGLSLCNFLRAFCEKNVMKSMIRLEMSESASLVKVRVVDSSAFVQKFSLILENLLNNSFAAGASTVLFRLFLEGENLLLEVIDDGRGISQAIIEEIKTSQGYQIASGGTGLLACRSLSHFLGIEMEIEQKKPSGAIVRLSMVCYQI